MSQYRKPNCKCLLCGKDIYRRPKIIAAGPVYCSNECYGKSNTILMKCSMCPNLFRAGLNKKTCSRACANKQKEGLSYNQLGRPIKDKVKDLNALKNRLIEKNGYKCCRCGYDKLNILCIHHIIEKSLGGSDSLDNLELLCPNCHAEEHYLRREKKKAEGKMTNEVKALLGQSIVNDEKIIYEMFKTTLNNIFDAKLDIQDEEALIMLCAQFADKIEEYKK